MKTKLLLSLLCAFGLAAVAQQTFTNIVINLPFPVLATVSNGTLFITAAPARTNDTNGFTVAFVVYSPSIPSQGPLSVTVDSSLGTYSVFHTPIHQWSYIWGDGSPIEDRTDYPDANFVSHVYPSPGTYPFTLIVTDSGGNTNSLSRQITVPVPALKASRRDGGFDLDPISPDWTLMLSSNLINWRPIMPSTFITNSQDKQFFRLMQP
jgi:hypothetical protein